MGFNANQSTTYTKTKVDNLLSPKATTTYVNDHLDLKAKQATTYKKQTETDATLGLKSNISDTTAALALKANITYVDDQLKLTANQLTTYTKTEVDDLVSPKSDKTFVDGQLSLKANQLTTYTETDLDTALVAKQPTIISTSALSIAGITTTGSITANKFISNF